MQEIRKLKKLETEIQMCLLMHMKDCKLMGSNGEESVKDIGVSC